jgi:hypothetical protein
VISSGVTRLAEADALHDLRLYLFRDLQHVTEVATRARIRPSVVGNNEDCGFDACGGDLFWLVPPLGERS